MKKHIKNILRPLLIVINSALVTASTLLLLAGVQNSAMAQNAAAAPTCESQIKTFIGVERKAFGIFLNEHFRSAKPTSTLIPVAIERFKQYELTIRAQKNKYLPVGDVKSGSAACDKAVAEDFQIMKELVRSHIIANAYAKKTTRLMDKYKSINDKLEKLNATLAQMYGNFGTFAQKLPFFVGKCVK